MSGKVCAIILLVLIILIVRFASAKSTEGFAAGSAEGNSVIRLYEDYKFEKLAYAYQGAPGQNYIKKIIKVNLKGAELSLPRIGGKYDEVRRIEIWGMNQGDNTASIAANFYNSYLEPENELRGNPAKYQQLIQILPGDHVRLQIVEPVKQIMLIAML